MELDYRCEYGDCHDIISKARKHWSLAHDVKLLKYLETFSQDLISRTGDVLKCVEDFEKDVNSVSISMQTTSQSFQSLANTQFIEHTVLEDDVSAYCKTSDNDIEVGNCGSNVLLWNALSTCLSSFHLKYNKHKDNIHIPTTPQISFGVGEGDCKAEDISPSIIENMQSEHPEHLDQNNVSDSLVNPLNGHLFSHHHHIPNNQHDFFSAKPFVEKALVEDDDLFGSFSEKSNSLLDENAVDPLSDSVARDTVPSNPTLHQPTHLSFPSYSTHNNNVSSNHSENHLTDESSAQTSIKISPPTSTTKTTTVLDKNEQIFNEEAHQTVDQTPSFPSSPSNQNHFSLFSDNQDSEDELFLSSSKNKSTKENFKKILEGKISSMVGNPNFKGSLGQNKINELSNENSNISERNLFTQTDDNNALPNFETPMLHSLAKSRPRIKSKRRPPSRKHLKEIKSSDQNQIDDMKGQRKDGAVSLLSPSTEEEDLFVVGTTTMLHQASSSNLFLPSSLLSPGSSLDNQNFTETFVAPDRISENNNINTEKDDEPSNLKSCNDDMKFGEGSSCEGWLGENEGRAKSSSKFNYHSKLSIFNDTDEEEDEDDDLFSTSITNKLNQKNPQTHHKSNQHSLANNHLFKDIFSNASDDEDLFKIKQSPSEKKQGTRTPNPTPQNGRKVLESSQDFNDPLSFFNNQTD